MTPPDGEEENLLVRPLREDHESVGPAEGPSSPAFLIYGLLIRVLSSQKAPEPVEEAETWAHLCGSSCDDPNRTRITQ